MKGIIISGQPRSGKSTFSKIFSNNSKINALIIDLMVIDIIKKKILFYDDSKIVIKSFLNNIRYQDSEKKIIRKPIDDILIEPEEIQQNIQKKYENNLELIFSVLNYWNKKKDRKIWVAPDLNAEFYFEKIKQINDIGVLFIIREPIETIAASLYWRSYPKRIGGIYKIIEKIIRWKVSLALMNKIAKENPERVNCIFFDKFKTLRLSKEIHPFLSKYNINFKTNYDLNKTYFNYDGDEKWYTPEKKWEKLLTNDEINLIKISCNPSNISKKSKKVKFSLRFINLIIEILYIIFNGFAKFSPFTCHIIINFFFNPILTMLNFLKIFKKKY